MPSTCSGRFVLAFLAFVGREGFSQQSPPQNPASPPPQASPQPSLTSAIPATTVFGDVSLSGYVDLYYQADFGHPPHLETETGRWYDINHDSYQFAAAEFDIARTPTHPKPFGFAVTVLEGSNSSILASTEPSGRRSYKDFAQAYVTYLVPVKPVTTIDFGKWYAFVGYEGLDSRSQDNYSRSFTFTSMEPDYMTGFRFTSALTSNLTVNAYLYQGYNEVQNSNSTIMTGAGATYAFTPKLTATLQGYNGKESDDRKNDVGTYGGIGFPTPGASWVTQENLVVVYQQNSRDKFAFDGTYASAVDKGVWNGEAVYYRRQFDSRNAGCLRVERAEDDDGLRFYNGDMTLHSLTGTYDFAVNQYILLRFELRHDVASLPFFDSSNGLAKQRTTLTFAQIIKF
jgi:Putative beta-barrel porin-2, OmpL-like. bbp2